MGNFRDLIVYKKAFVLALDKHNITKRFPKEEQYSLTDQIKRSSRSVCINMAEGFRKIRYRAHFVSKHTDADMENSETGVWLDFCLAFEYLTQPEYEEFFHRSEEIGKLLNHIIENPEKYGAK